MANYGGVKLDKPTCQQITAEIMQTYDLSKFAIELSNGSTLLKIPPYKTTWSQSALHEHQWRAKTVDWPNRERQMYKCAVPENIHTTSTEGIGISWGVGGSVRPKNWKKCMKLNRNFQRGGGVLEKIPSIGEVCVKNTRTWLTYFRSDYNWFFLIR